MQCVSPSHLGVPSYKVTMTHFLTGPLSFVRSVNFFLVSFLNSLSNIPFLSLCFPLGLPFFRPLPSMLSLLFSSVRILGHYILKLTPQRLDRRELVADGDHFFERSIQLVYVLKDGFETLWDGSGLGLVGNRGSEDVPAQYHQLEDRVVVRKSSRARWWARHLGLRYASLTF
jgi:hypothetical protein